MNGLSGSFGLPGYLQHAMFPLWKGSLCAFSSSCPLVIKE